jgi:hypothetical protein
MAELVRIENPSGRFLQPGWVRVHFSTDSLMPAVGMEPDMTEAAHARYLDLIREYVSTVEEPITFEATGYRYGPAAGGDEAFIEFALRGLDVAQIVVAIVGLVSWLRAKGAGEIRVSESGIEALGQAELERRGYRPVEPISVGLTPGRGETSWGTPRTWGGYAAVFRLPDGSLAVLLYTLDGIVQELSIPTGRDDRAGEMFH